MRVYLHWGNELGARIVEKDGQVDASVLPFRSVEEFLLQTCEEFGVTEVYGSNPPFGLTEKFKEITLHFVPTHRNIAAFYLTYLTAVAEPKIADFNIKWHKDKAEVDGNFVSLPSLACTCPHKFATTPCRHVVAVAHAIKAEEFVDYLGKFVRGEPVERGEDDDPIATEKPPAISALFWDCSRLGCYLHKRRPRLEVVEDKVYMAKGVRPAFFNIDGIALVNMKPVLIEWKVNKVLPKSQYILFKELSKRGILVFVVCGDPVSMTVEFVRLFKDGVAGDFVPVNDVDKLVEMILEEVF